MTISEQDWRILDGLAAAKEQHEGLAELLDFYGDLFRVLFKAKARLKVPFEARDEEAVRRQLSQETPQLTFDRLRIEPTAFALLVSNVTDVLVRYNPDWADLRDETSTEELRALARESFEAGALPTEVTSTTDLTALAVGFALVPYLQRAAEAIMPLVDQERWKRTYCPMCGGAPDFAFLEEESGARYLLCSRCSSQWLYWRLKCPFCGTDDHTKLFYYPGEDGVYRLYVCQVCHRYVKAIDLRKVGRQVLFPVERVTTVAMDVAAREEGYQ